MRRWMFALSIIGLIAITGCANDKELRADFDATLVENQNLKLKVRDLMAENQQLKAQIAALQAELARYGGSSVTRSSTKSPVIK